jgi:hypothetical protein
MVAAAAMRHTHTHTHLSSRVNALVGASRGHRANPHAGPHRHLQGQGWEPLEPARGQAMRAHTHAHTGCVQLMAISTACCTVRTRLPLRVPWFCHPSYRVPSYITREA